jgi:integrase
MLSPKKNKKEQIEMNNMIINEPIFKTFCRERNLSTGSIKVYSHALGKYIEYNQLTLTELITEAETEEDQRLRWKRRTLKHRLIQFRNHLIDYGYAKETITTMMKRVTTFYRHYEIEIHHLPRVNIQSTVEIKIPTRENLQTALESSKPLMKALILFLVSSGMSKVDCLKLTIQDFIIATEDYHNSTDILEVMSILKDRNDVTPTFALTRTKTNKFHYTFCSPEATTSIVNYLYSRKDTLKPESPLFKISPLWLSIKFEDLNESLNLGVTSGNNYGILRCHTLRKYHATTLRNDGLSIDIINSLQGKAKNRVDQAYYIDTPEQLKKLYLDHVNCLYVSDELKFKSENEVLQEENKTLKERENKLLDIMERLERLEQMD